MLKCCDSFSLFHLFFFYQPTESWLVMFSLCESVCVCVIMRKRSFRETFNTESLQLLSRWELDAQKVTKTRLQQYGDTSPNESVIEAQLT